MLWIFWDPDSEFFRIPLIDWPIAWYGILFATGFLIGYFIFRDILWRRFPEFSKDFVTFLSDHFMWFIVVGTIVGARLGHVFFYEEDISFFDVFKVWEGGLASHGGAVGVFIALLLYWFSVRKKCPGLSFILLADFVVIPAALLSFFVRLGNFFNQEILGIPTEVPWAVVFGAPRDGGAIVPRHPVQLYEGCLYLAIFIGLYLLWRFKGMKLREGVLTGIFLISVFSGRFLLEFFKEKQSALIGNDSFLLMGQYLSIPFVIIGLLLLVRGLWKLWR